MKLLHKFESLRNNRIIPAMSTDTKHVTKYEKIEMDKLRREVRKALIDLKVTRNFFDLASGNDQVEYAIYAMLAAEHKYGMLLNKAKKMNVDWAQYKGVVQ